MESGLLKGGHNLYGHRIGILMIEGRFPRPAGAIGNASSFPFPVMHHVVKGFSGNRTVRDLAALNPESDEFRKGRRCALPRGSGLPGDYDVMRLCHSVSEAPARGGQHPSLLLIAHVGAVRRGYLEGRASSRSNYCRRKKSIRASSSRSSYRPRENPRCRDGRLP